MQHRSWFTTLKWGSANATLMSVSLCLSTMFSLSDKWDPAETEGTLPGELSPQLGAPVGSREWAIAWLKSTPIIKALWKGEEKTQKIEQNLQWGEKEQEEEVYEEAQNGEIDSTTLPDSQTE
ncbi:UNVERIFIED_CONTAM: hypothetical protein FKN15_074758 [Acipenser sinensis]